MYRKRRIKKRAPKVETKEKGYLRACKGCRFYKESHCTLKDNEISVQETKQERCLYFIDKER